MSKDIESVNPTTMQATVEALASAPVTRREQDSIGEMDVPIDAYYGVQSLRAQRNFPITGQPMHPMFIRNLALVKKAAAITNRAAGSLEPEKAAAIIGACEEVMAGRLADQFIACTEVEDDVGSCQCKMGAGRSWCPKVFADFNAEIAVL